VSATQATDRTTPSGPVLYLAFERGRSSWKLAFTTDAGQKSRLRSLAAGSLVGLGFEIKRAKERFGLAPEAPVISCYEAGRDGFWLHRFLVLEGVQNLVVDSASIEVNRRKRRAKSDRLDAVKLVTMLGYGNDSRQNGPWSSRFLHNEALARTGRDTGRGLSV
jgi:transposase